MSSGKAKDTGTQTQTSAPWAPQQEYLLAGFKKAGEALDALPENAYAGPAIAGITQGQKDSAQGQFDLGSMLKSQGFGNDFLSMATATARGDYLNPATNPALQGAIDTSNRSVTNWLETSALPAVRDSSIASGYYGGSRQGVAQANAINEGAAMARDNANNIILGNYNTERQNQLNSAQLLSQGVGLQQMPLQLQSEAAGVLQGYDQAALDKILGDQSYAYQAPYLGLQDYMALIDGTYGGTKIDTGTTAKSSTAGNMLKGSAGGFMMGSQLDGPWGGAIGAGVGALGGLL